MDVVCPGDDATELLKTIIRILLYKQQNYLNVHQKKNIAEYKVKHIQINLKTFIS